MNEKGEGMDMKNVEMRGRTTRDTKSDTKDSVNHHATRASDPSDLL